MPTLPRAEIFSKQEIADLPRPARPGGQCTTVSGTGKLTGQDYTNVDKEHI